jgi:hypothetical protein
VTGDVWIFLGLLVTAGMPVVLAWQASRARRQERKDDNDRQDAVAARVEEAAKATKEVSKTLAAATQTTNDKLDAQHLLINSLYTASKQGELVMAEVALLALKDNADLRRAMGKEPTTQAVGAVEALEAKVKELRAELSERAAAAKVAEALKEHQQATPKVNE